MVSTRQMATIGNVNSNTNAAENSAPAPSSLTNIVRSSFMTKQNSCDSSTNDNKNSIKNWTFNVNTGPSGIQGSTSVVLTNSLSSLSASTTAAGNNDFNANYNCTTINVTRPGRSTTPSNNRKCLLDLPQEILNKILSYTDYKNISQLRLVSHKMNEVCMGILNSTFSKLVSITYNRFQAIKANMPRRESARRKHPLACECDIIETCYMRLSLLQMTFGKHIERGHCCFFPGMILDEVFNILSYIKTTSRLERPYRLTDELFDLSTMAMEYFRDNIEPTLPGIAYFNKDFFNRPSSSIRPALVISTEMADSSVALPSPPQSNMVLRKGIRKIKQGMKIYSNQLSVLRNELRSCKRKGTEQAKQIVDQKKLIEEQRKQILELANRLDENDKKNEEMSRKFSTLLQELNKCKTELQYGRSKSPANTNCTSCGQRLTNNLNPIFEDYQFANAANQVNVKMENKNHLNIIETGSRRSLNVEHGDNVNHNDFINPDEITTAKLISMNSAAKRLKYSNSVKNVIETELKNIWSDNEPSTSSAAGQPFKRNKNINNNNNNNVGKVEESTNNNNSFPDVKKARRVQKTNRSYNVGGTKRKNYLI